MNCPKCNSIMKCNGTNEFYQDWHCDTCGYNKEIKKEPPKIPPKKSKSL